MRLYKRGRIWWIEYHQDGKYIRKSTGFADRDSAEDVLEQYQAAKRQSRKTKKTKTIESLVEGLVGVYGISFEKFCEDHKLTVRNSEEDDGKFTGTPLKLIWEKYQTTAKAIGKFPESPITIRKRRRVVERFAEWCALNFSTVETVEAVDGNVAVKFAAHLAKSELTTKTRKSILGDVVSVWNIVSKMLSKVGNPWTKLAPRDTDGKEGDAFTPDEEQRIFDAAKKIGKDWFAICKIMRNTSLRYGDVANLTWDKIDLKTNTIHDPGKEYYTPRKTSAHKIKTKPVLIPEVVEILKGLSFDGDDAYLFPLHAHLYGKSGHGAYDKLNFREVLDEAEVFREGLTIHSWRHTALTRLDEAGVDRETRKRIGGHTVDSTADRYQHNQHIAENMAAMIAASKLKK